MTFLCWLLGHKMIQDMDSTYARCCRNHCGYQINVNAGCRR